MNRSFSDSAQLGSCKSREQYDVEGKLDAIIEQVEKAAAEKAAE